MITKYIEPFAKYGGIVAISFEWLAVLLFYFLQPSAFDGEHPISYFAALPQTHAIFSVCYIMAAMSFWIFTKYHLKKYYIIPTKLFALSMLGFAAVATVPFNPYDATSAMIHGILAQIFSLAFLAGMLLTALKSTSRNLRWVSIVMVVAGLIFIFSFLALPIKSPLVFLFEAAAGITCQLWVLWVTYHSYRKVAHEYS